MYFGQGSYGVKSAAERYFLFPDSASPFGVAQTQLSQLNIGQAALLAGLINNPTGDSPFNNPQGTKNRRAITLDRMVAEHYITQAQADYWNNSPLPTIVPPPDLRPTNAWVSEVESRIMNDPIYSSLGRTPQERRTRCSPAGCRSTPPRTRRCRTRPRTSWTTTSAPHRASPARSSP